MCVHESPMVRSHCDMPARFDQLASDLQTLRTLLLETEKKQPADKLAPIRGARERLVMAPSWNCDCGPPLHHGTAIVGRVCVVRAQTKHGRSDLGGRLILPTSAPKKRCSKQAKERGGHLDGHRARCFRDIHCQRRDFRSIQRLEGQGREPEKRLDRYDGKLAKSSPLAPTERDKGRHQCSEACERRRSAAAITRSHAR
jgi:hypothetical protein